MFIDRARIYVEAGAGGDGMSSFRREKFVEKGGPNGGNGGRGGSVILRADKNLNTLIDFRYKRKFVAKRGGQGGNSNCTGHRADDVIVKVPMARWCATTQPVYAWLTLLRTGRNMLLPKAGAAAKAMPAMQRLPTVRLLLPKKANRVKTAGLSWSLTFGGCRACRLSQCRQIKHYCAGIGSKAGNCGVPFYHADPCAWRSAYRCRTQLCAGGYSGPY